MFTLILPAGCCLGAANGLSSALDAAESISGMHVQPIKNVCHTLSLYSSVLHRQPGQCQLQRHPNPGLTTRLPLPGQ